MRYLLFGILFFLVAACTNTADENERSEAESNEIRIYSDGIGWKKKTKCKVVYKGEKLKARIKFRGGSSSKYDKHSMTLELKKKRSLAGLPKDDDWVLNASYIDKTFQRHKLSYDLFRAMNPLANKAPKCAYVPVYLNDNYQGLYVLMEKVNGGWLELNEKWEDDVLFKDPFVFIEERLDNVQDPNNYYQQKFPKKSRAHNAAMLDELKRLLFEGENTDSIAQLLDLHWLDIQNVIDWQLLLMLTNNDDGLYKNFYLYQTRETRLQFIPWDYDHSFGRDGDYQLNLIDRELGWERMILFKRLMESESIGYKERLKARWFELRKSVFTEKYIFDLIEANEKEIRPHVEANAKRWPLDAKWYSDANDYDQEIDIIKQFIPMRLQQLDDFFNTL